MTFAVAVTWHAHPGAEARVEAILAEMIALTRTEPGCLTYEPHRAIDGAGVYFIYEQFVDEAGFEAHLASEHYRRLILGEVVKILDHRERSLWSSFEPR
jgi:quinol monooxygenase YgiN